MLGEGDTTRNIFLTDCHHYLSDILKQNKERIVVTVGFLLLFSKKIKPLVTSCE